MTTNHTSQVSLGLADADDPRMAFAAAVALGTAVIDHVGPHQLSNPTPCDEFDVRALLDHLVMVLRRIAALGRAEDAFGPGVVTPVDGDAHLQQWRAAAAEVETAWVEDSVLAQTIRLPWAEQSGAATLVSYLNEVTVHTWDLATATGQHPAWDPEIVSLAFDGIRFMPGEDRATMFEGMRAGMPPGLADFTYPFADAVPIPDDASLIDRLVAWNGRHP